MKTGSESIEAVVRKMRNLFAGFGVHMRTHDTAVPKFAMFGVVVGGADCVGRGRGSNHSGWGISSTTSKLSVLTPTSRRQPPRTRGNVARRRNKGRKVSW